MSFPLGQVVATPGALEAFSAAGDDFRFYLARHLRRDWGVVCNSDKRMNDRALKEGTRLLSAYDRCDATTRVWIITEADRSATTILLPDEY